MSLIPYSFSDNLKPLDKFTQNISFLSFHKQMQAHTCTTETWIRSLQATKFVMSLNGLASEARKGKLASLWATLWGKIVNFAHTKNLSFWMRVWYNTSTSDATCISSHFKRSLTDSSHVIYRRLCRKSRNEKAYGIWTDKDPALLQRICSVLKLDGRCV